MSIRTMRTFLGLEWDEEQAAYIRRMPRAERLAAAKHGWLNWHMNRGRIPLSATDEEMRRYKRRVSWRRVH